ncbi:MAG: DUF4038 domain-containing protein [Fimbriimonadaceae bacterium]|nr:DUF4038 domain-containing protein [Fimbriimonadaceae bacterium]
MIRVSDNRRYLARADGKPFFYLGDTAWELFHRLTRDEIEHYVATRAAQGFTVIQAVCLAEFDGLRTPNAEGHLPLHDMDPTRPNDAYFQLVDHAVARAALLGLTVGMLPTWGDKWTDEAGGGPVVFSQQNAEVYGRFLSDRYAGKPIVWILGGDRAVRTVEHRAVLRAMAKGLRAGKSGKSPISFHPRGGSSSGDYWPNERWLDFHMLQSGHCVPLAPNDEMVAKDYARTPTKPCMDGEPAYEDHPRMKPDWTAAGGTFLETEIRPTIYRALFAGGHGHTYGCHDVWQFFDPTKREAVNGARTPWQEALELPVARQVQFAKRLMLSRPFFARRPLPGAIESHPDLAKRCLATGDGKTYLMAYTPIAQPLTVQTETLPPTLRASWFEPSHGRVHDGRTQCNSGSMHLEPPGEGDWVLVLDAVDANYPAPGHV